MYFLCLRNEIRITQTKKNYANDWVIENAVPDSSPDAKCNNFIFYPAFVFSSLGKTYESVSL